MAAEVEIVFKAVDNTAGAFGGILNNLGSMGSIVTGIKAAFDLAGDAVKLFTGYAEQGLDAIATYERLSLALETLSASQVLISGQAKDMTEALQMTAGQAEELLKWMQELAIKSPFTLEGVANAFRLAEAYGFSADEAKRMTEALINFAAGTGAPEDAMRRIALALGQIEAKGKLSGQEVLQLVNAGLPVTQILANAFGVTTAEIEKMRTDGLIPAQDAIEAITVYMETNFAGAAERQATSWAGLKGTFADIKQMGLREFFGGMFDVLQPLAIELSNFLQNEGLDKLRDLGDQLGTLTQNFIDFAGKLQGASGVDLTEMFSNWISNIDWEQISRNFAEKLNSIDWGSVNTGFGNLSDAFTDVLIAIDWSAVAGAIWESLIQGFMVVIDNGANSLIRLLADAFTQGDVSILQDKIKGFLTFGFDDIGRAIVDGLISGVKWAWNNFVSLFTFGFDDVIDFVKKKLGISSPSTVFAEIGRNIVQGLIDGWNNLFATFKSLINSGINEILRLFAPFLALFGVSVPTGGTVGGTAGGSTGGTGGTLPGSGYTIIHNNYSTVYYGYTNNAGDYDCPSPHPLVASSGNQLVRTGF